MEKNVYKHNSLSAQKATGNYASRSHSPVSLRSRDTPRGILTQSLVALMEMLHLALLSQSPSWLRARGSHTGPALSNPTGSSAPFYTPWASSPCLPSGLLDKSACAFPIISLLRRAKVEKQEEHGHFASNQHRFHAGTYLSVSSA